MRYDRVPRLAPILALVFGAWAAAAGEPPAQARIAIPGGEGGIGFDDLRLAPSLHRVLAPAGRTGALALVDPKTHEVSLIRGFGTAKPGGGGHGEGTTSADEGDGVLFAVDRSSQELVVVDGTTRRILGRAKLAGGPDYVRYVAPTSEVWVTEPDREQIEVFRLSGTPPLPEPATAVRVKGGPEALVMDARRGRAYSHLWKGTTVAIDLKSHEVAESWPNGCEGSRGMAMDRERGFLFVGCKEGKAVVLDVEHGGKILGTASSGSGVDIIDYDGARRHLYFPGSKSATMAILSVSPAGALSVLGTLPTATGSHCVVSDQDGTAYVCDPKAGALIAIKDPFER